MDKRKKRTVDTGREGRSNHEAVTAVFSDRGGRRQRIGQHRPFALEKWTAIMCVRHGAWWELSLDSDEGGQEAGSSDLLVMCKV